LINDYSIEMACENIIDYKTRKYFEEVYSSYTSGNYRSAVVMLWSVIVCDILFKLDQLSTAFGDVVAKGILAEVEKTQKANPRSSEWEWNLVKAVYEKMSLLNAIEFKNLSHIQEHRHFSAHPVITGGEKLFSPSKETARAHIRNALEAVLTKPAVMTKKVFDTLVEDLEQMAPLLPDRASLKRYLEAKYFPHFVSVVENGIFKSLWRLVFKSGDERAEANRPINFRALVILYYRRPHEIDLLVANEKDYFSDFVYEGTRIERLIDFMSHIPNLFVYLNDSAQLLINNYVNANIGYYLNAWFMNESESLHLDKVLEKIEAGELWASGDSYKTLCDKTKGTAIFIKAIQIGIELYGKSLNFDTADNLFSSMVKPNLSHFRKEEIELLLTRIEGNSQTYDRRKAKRDHKELLTFIYGLMGSAYDLSAFPHFMQSVAAEG